MLIVCIDKLDIYTNLTIGKRYLVTGYYRNEYGNYYVFSDDFDHEVAYSKKYFKHLYEIRRNKLKKIC